MTTINLGDTIKDKYSGFKGIATAKLEFINGCIQFEVTAKTKENKSPEPIFIDSQSLILVKSNKKEEDEVEFTGGKMMKITKGGSYNSKF